MATKVINIRHLDWMQKEVLRSSSDHVQIDRWTKWGNPFIIGVHGDRRKVVELYAGWVRTQPHLMASLHELKDKTLMCWCAPELCHGDVLAELADGS